MLEVVEGVNRCQISEMEKAAQANESCAEFVKRVHNVHAAIVHTYQIVAYHAIRESDPSKAAEWWREMNAFCDAALRALKQAKALYPECGTSQLYDLALDYKSAAWKRYTENLEDAECPTNLLPTNLFPAQS